MSTSKKIAILSGGGAKGLIQVSCMAALQETGKKDFTAYDLIVGSSAGAINGTLLALQAMTPQRLLAIYPEMLGEIFKKKFFHFVPVYDRINFQKCWSKYVPLVTKFRDCKSHMIITSVDVCTDITNFFKSWEQQDGDRPVMDVVERSFAAPFYFGQIADLKDQKVWYDGGCGYYNIPIDYGYTEAQIQNWIGNYDIQIDAYGTGFSDTSTSYDKASKQGFLSQLYNFMFPGEGGMARVQSRLDQVRKMTKIASSVIGVKFDYYDIEIPKKLDQMDDLKHQAEYIEFGKQMAKAPLISR